MARRKRSALARRVAHLERLERERQALRLFDARADSTLDMPNRPPTQGTKRAGWLRLFFQRLRSRFHYVD